MNQPTSPSQGHRHELTPFEPRGSTVLAGNMSNQGVHQTHLYFHLTCSCCFGERNHSSKQLLEVIHARPGRKRTLVGSVRGPSGGQSGRGSVVRLILLCETHHLDSLQSGLQEYHSMPRHSMGLPYMPKIEPPNHPKDPLR